MPFLQANAVTDSKDGVKRLMVLCAGRGYKRHPISVCRGYCKYYGGLQIGGIICNWHPEDAELTFTPREEKLPDAGDVSAVADLI